MFSRLINLPWQSTDSFFLWGPRQTGKSTLLKQLFPNELYVDLLQTDLQMEYAADPSRFREKILAIKPIPEMVIVDEIQKVPLLLDEVHLLIEKYKINFALCGSSARKVKRGHANLLGGRALRYELSGLSAKEIGNSCDLVKLLNSGYLPRHYLQANYWDKLRGYISDYLKEEIADEALVRNLPAFSRFLEIAALTDCEQVNYSNISRECGVSMPTVKEYFQILKDTLLSDLVEPFSKKLKRRVVTAPKLYFSDVGVVNYLAKRKELLPGSSEFGKAFENWVYHEIKCKQIYKAPDDTISYWRTSSGFEVDFIINDNIAIEAKASKKILPDHLKNLRILAEECPTIKKKIVVCLEDVSRITDDGINILPWQHFVEWLWE